MKIEKSPDLIKIEELIQLYTDCFSKGLSEQHIDLKELKLYLKTFFENGKIISVFDQNKLAGALLAIPIGFDNYFPDNLKIDFENKNVWYVAEMMIEENFRAKGWGQKLLNEFLSDAKQFNISDVFIRVWNQNLAALSLYRKIGFVDVAEIEQTKTKADLSGTFTMKKIYLHKEIC
jgi:ribosomal protein S18 acetylase RimI-like enzyme